MTAFKTTKGLSLLVFLALLLGSLLPLGLSQQANAENPDTLTPSKTTTDVSDYAEVLSDSAIKQFLRLNKEAKAQDNNAQFAIVTVKSTNGQSIADFTNDLTLRKEWHVGSSKKDNGVLIVFAENNGQNNVRVATGTGIEQTLPDATIHRLLLQNEKSLKSHKEVDINLGIFSLYQDLANIADPGFVKENPATDTIQQYVDGRDKRQSNQSTYQKQNPVQQEESPVANSTSEKSPATILLLVLAAALLLIVIIVMRSLAKYKKASPKERAQADPKDGHYPRPSIHFGGPWGFLFGWLLASFLSSRDRDRYHGGDGFDDNGSDYGHDFHHMGDSSGFDGFGDDGFGGGFDGGDFGGGGDSGFGGGDFGGGGSDF
ncbi:TPM domain-containing protein [Fructobacillus sp. M1-13]|uniref:TPM domain-containing protein n=1 Tax=Fructobacillus papyriferae TaxID=2713171 RepID=A0ABS5QQB2_9LACO|nr:TPM domain-containing protein [Fructobacillus papyriferae]MBS9335291.1 TPM domain-containing protein [Fructobacillus papyriferae]MCD2159040.1 TPM domain-containing protein [Fructobacillus papyriferae]